VELGVALGVLSDFVDELLSDDVDEPLSELLELPLSDELLALSPPVDAAVEDDFPRLSFL
jgi:hypothetical protein